MAQTVIVRNSGTHANTVTPAVLIGVDPGDFVITADGCAGVTLTPEGTCTIGVAFTPIVAGIRTASVRVTGSADTSAVAALAGAGTAEPVVVFSPAVAKGGSVTVAVGAGFPPGTALTAAFDDDGSPPRTVTTDGAGGFRLAMVVRSGEAPGTRRLTVPGQPGGFPGRHRAAPRRARHLPAPGGDGTRLPDQRHPVPGLSGSAAARRP